MLSTPAHFYHLHTLFLFCLIQLFSVEPSMSFFPDQVEIYLNSLVISFILRLLVQRMNSSWAWWCMPGDHSNWEAEAGLHH